MSETLQTTLFERIGGAAAIDRLVEAFYRNMDAFPEAQTIRAMHPPELAPIKRTLKHYLTEWTGGPKLFTPEKGHPRLRQRHLGFRIGIAERDAWLSCMGAALSEAVHDGMARAEMHAALAKLADWMRNQGDNPHDAQRHRPG